MHGFGLSLQIVRHTFLLVGPENQNTEVKVV